ncbi:MAG: zinc ribbon domain-containing protein [Promethearchaeota archaeon]
MSKYCTNCGKEILDDWNICPECGTPHIDQEGSRVLIESEQDNSYFENNEREHLVASFKGKANWGNKVFEGKLLLTNLRIAGIGFTKEVRSKFTGKQTAAIIAAGLLAGPIGTGALSSIVKSDVEREIHSFEDLIENELAKTLSKEMLQNFNCNLPIIKAFNIERTSTLTYSIPLYPLYESGLKEIRFTIASTRDKQENKQDFRCRRAMIFDLIEKTLLKTHELSKYEINYESRLKPSDFEYYLFEFLVNNQGSAFTPDAIWKRKDKLGMPQEFNGTTPEQIGDGLDKLYSRDDVHRGYREGKYFYYY